MNDCRLIRPLLVLVVMLLLVLAVQGCSLTGTELTTSGEAFEPHMTWAGDRFGIIYYHAEKKGGPVHINMLTVDDKGKVLSNAVAIDKQVNAPVKTPYGQFRLSELVWNAEHEQFAFAYSYDQGSGKGVGVRLVTLNANLGGIQSKPAALSFGPSGAGAWTELYYPSLVWNRKLDEYALAFTHEDYLNNTPVKKNSLRLTLFDSNGMTKPPAARNLYACADGCRLTSLTVNPKIGQYAVAYYGPSRGAELIVFDAKAGAVQTAGNHQLLKGTETLNHSVLFDVHSDDYFYTNDIYGSELAFSIVQQKGTMSKIYTKGKGYDRLFSVAPFGWAFHGHVICATDTSAIKIHCWNVLEGTTSPPSGHQKDMAVTPAGSSQPSVATINKVLPYLVWVQNGTLRFEGFTQGKAGP